MFLLIYDAQATYRGTIIVAEISQWVMEMLHFLYICVMMK